ncbi:pyruvate ferredoxin oxidoreductase [Desulforhopalus singaporensis]|uniref:2-oxoglutarate ferredoxin oxidoreductase subunit alpha n=1 Tax=Desulforhopalus singaporensis TaxID=91360 RepID=A0A1H0N8I4_9BACT|nr:pyruvate ferredoxin oxidoreductase [Desulforhopalus singaporensis]SDO88826.1 2-oxoglutarate ferredoxin oxidoreductase subunit alpha [Desulforhopalus singaporensis]
MESNTLFMKNSEIFAEAMIRCGIRYHFAYPITPATDVMKYTAAHFHKVGGRMFQAESELAVINCLTGLAATGQLGCASTSGPGFDLMQEGIGFMTAAELPCILLDNMRVGPGDGDIIGSQQDYFMATRGGSHGDYYIPVYAPASGQEIVDLMPVAIDRAFTYRTPVLFVMDGVMAQMIETVDFTPAKETVSSYDTGEWSYTGAKDRGKRALITGSYAHSDGEQMVKKLMAKAEAMTAKEQLWEEYELEDAEVVVCAFGLPGRVCREIVQERRKQGEKIGFIRPITLFPFPEKVFAGLPGSVREILVVEMNYGQMVQDVRLAVNGRCNVSHYGHVGGDQPMIKAREVRNRLAALVPA